MAGAWNVLVLVADSFRLDAVGAFGGRARTRAIDRLARQGVRFTNFLPGSFPTGPFRRDLHTGRFNFVDQAWAGPWARDEVLLGEVAAAAGYHAAVIADTPAVRGYDLRVAEVQHTRQEAEAGSDANLPLPADARKLRLPMRHLQRILATEASWGSEEERHCPRTIRAAHRWLEQWCAKGRSRSPFLLVVDTFDPHEPWDAPQYYTNLYGAAGYAGDRLIEPAYEPAGYAEPDEMEYMRALYLAEATMVDRWLGFLLEGLERTGLRDETAVVFLSDHGFYHGDNGLVGKVHLDREGRLIGRWPLFNAIARVPMIVSLPGGPRNEERRAICQTPDVTATVVELMGARPANRHQGRSLIGIIQGREEDACRDLALSSCTFVTDAQVRCPVTVRTAEWTYVYGGDEWPHQLFRGGHGPEGADVFADQRDVAEDLHQRMLRTLGEWRCPESSLTLRTPFGQPARPGLPPTRRI